jgi:hypothetical protein
MRAKVRRFLSPDVDLSTYVPESPRDVEIFVQIIAGPADGPGDESFNLTVLTPEAAERRVRERGPQLGRHLLIVESWDSARVLEFLTAAVEAEEADTWAELGSRLGRVGRWEFEDYRA